MQLKMPVKGDVFSALMSTLKTPKLQYAFMFKSCEDSPDSLPWHRRCLKYVSEVKTSLSSLNALPLLKGTNDFKAVNTLNKSGKIH